MVPTLSMDIYANLVQVYFSSREVCPKIHAELVTCLTLHSEHFHREKPYASHVVSFLGHKSTVWDTFLNQLNALYQNFQIASVNIKPIS